MTDEKSFSDSTGTFISALNSLKSEDIWNRDDLLIAIIKTKSMAKNIIFNNCDYSKQMLANYDNDNIFFTTIKNAQLAAELCEQIEWRIISYRYNIPFKYKSRFLIGIAIGVSIGAIMKSFI